MQVNERINSANLMLVSSQTQTSDSTNTKNNSASTDFSSYLSFSANNQSNNVNNVGKPEVSQRSKEDTSSKDTAKVTNENEVKDDTKVNDKSKETDNSKVEQIKDADKTNSASESNKAQETTKESEIVDNEEDVLSTEDLQSVLELVGNVMQLLMNELGLSVEEITNKLDSFGMECTDLLSKEGMKEFFLNLQNANPTDLLVNEDLQGQLQEVLSQLDEILVASDFSVTDNADLLDNPEVQTVVDNFTKALSDTLQGKEENGQKEALDVSKANTNEADVIVTNNKNSTEQGTSHNGDTNASADGKEMPKTEILESKSESTSKTPNDFQNPILQAINEAMGTRVENVIPQEAVVSPREIINQIVEQIKVNMNQDNTTMQMNLYPEHLGKIQINIVSKDGIMTAKIVAETEAAKQAIEGGLTNLKESFEQQDLKVDAIEVMVSTTGFERSDENSNASQENSKAKRNHKINLSELDDNLEEEQNAEAEKMKAVGSSVSYSA